MLNEVVNLPLRNALEVSWTISISHVNFAVIRLRGVLYTGSLLLMPLIGIGTASLLVPISSVMSTTYQISPNFERFLSPLIKQRVTNWETKEGFAREWNSCSLIRRKYYIYYTEA